MVKAKNYIKVGLVSGNQPGDKFFITYPPAEVECA